MDENRKLIHTYEILKKDFSKAIPRWKVPEQIKCGFDKINSLEDVSNYILKYYSEEHWKLIKEEITKKATIYDFEGIPHRDSNAARNPGKYLPHIIKIKIKSTISLENKLKGDKK